MRHKQLASAAVAALSALALLPGAASGQAHKTFVSGVGDDVNPCSRTAPCKTFRGTIAKTATGGEIDVLDTGNFMDATVATIDKSLTIDGNGNHAGMSSVTGLNGFNVTAPPGSKVVLRDIRLNGLRSFTTPAAYGIQHTGGGHLLLDNMRVFGYSTAGVSIQGDESVRLTVRNSSVHDNRVGVQLLSSPGGTVRGTIRRSDVDDNGDGVVLDSTAGGAVFGNLIRSAITDSGIEPALGGFGLWSNGPRSTARISGNEIMGNVVGIRAENGGRIFSARNNDIYGNIDANGNPTDTYSRK